MFHSGRDVDRGHHAWGRTVVIQELSVLPAQYSCEPKTALKNNVFKLKKYESTCKWPWKNSKNNKRRTNYKYIELLFLTSQIARIKKLNVMLSEAVRPSQILHSGMQNALEGSLAKYQTMTYTFNMWPCKISIVNLMTQL